MSEIVTEYLSFDKLDGELKLVFDYWLSLRGDRLGPRWREFDLMKIPAKKIPFTIITDIINKEEGLMKYRFVGTDFYRVHGIELTGKNPLDVPPEELGKKLNQELLDIVREQKPTYSIHHLREIRRLHILQHVLRLPLSDDGKEVTHILSVVDYIEDKKELEDYLSAPPNAES